MDYTIKSFQEIIPSAESDLPAGVKLCSGSLFLSLSLHSTRPAGLNSIVVIDTRFPSSSPPALLNARRLWPDGTTRIGSSERKRIRSLLKNVCDLRTVLLFGTSSCPQSKSRDRFLHLAIDLVAGSGARVKEMLVLAGGIKPYVDHYQGWALEGNAVCSLPVTEIVATVRNSEYCFYRPGIYVSCTIPADLPNLQALAHFRDIRSIINTGPHSDESLTSVVKKYNHVPCTPGTTMSAVSLGEVADQLSRDLAKQRSVLITGPLAPFAVVWFLVEAAGAETSQAVRHVQRKLPSFQPTTEQTILLGYLEKSRQNPSHRVEIDAFVQSNNGIYINEPLSWEDHILRMQEETQDEFATVASTLHKLFSNIVNTPTDQRYRRLRQSNKRIAALIQWRTVREYLLQCGWQPQPDELVFVSADLQSLRDGILRFSASVYI